MQFGDIHRDALSASVIPWPRADPIACVDGTGPLSAEVRVPGGAATARSHSHRLAICVSPGQSAIVSAIAFADARYEETHGLWWRLRAALASATLRWVLSDQDKSAYQKHQSCNNDSCYLSH